MTTYEEYKSQTNRAFRKAFTRVMKFAERDMFQGMTEEEYRKQQYDLKCAKAMKQRDKAQQLLHLNNTVLRKGRIESLNALKSVGEEEENGKLRAALTYLHPDGAVATGGDQGPMLLTADSSVAASSSSSSSSASASSSSSSSSSSSIITTANSSSSDTPPPPPVTLPQARSCYCCKVRFTQLHHFYDQLCPTCAPLNWSKRHQSANLSGRIAVVTGARVKIGYQVVLKLLRSNCTVLALTRFPASAAFA
jgi:hypothetical protein